MADYAKDVLVDTQWVQDHLEDENIRIVEVDENPGLYDEAHIPGAIGFDWKKDLQDQVKRDFLASDAFGEAPALLCMADHLLSVGVVRAAAEAPRAALALAVDRRLGHAWVDEADVTRVRSAGGQIRAIGKRLLVYDCYDTGLFRVTGALVDVLQGMAAPALSEGVAALARMGQAVTADIGDAAWLDVDDARALRLAVEHWRD